MRGILLTKNEVMGYERKGMAIANINTPNPASKRSQGALPKGRVSGKPLHSASMEFSALPKIIRRKLINIQ